MTDSPKGWICLTESEIPIVKGLLEAAAFSPDLAIAANSVLEKIKFMEENAANELAGAYYGAALREEEE